jgi:hypothetical protein
MGMETLLWVVYLLQDLPGAVVHLRQDTGAQVQRGARVLRGGKGEGGPAY